MENTALFIPVLFGSIRDERISDKDAAYVASLLKARGIQTELIDPKSLHKAESTERKDPEPWASLMEKADALVIVSPEYNHGYPGALKEVLDSCYDEYKHKPVAICGASGGGLGGARAVEQLRQVVIELSMVPIHNAVYFSMHQNLWDEKGQIKDPSYAERVNTMIDELTWYAHALKAARAQN
ncbi:MAG TPA: NADPH-dependent FMN reductase [Patescibacteria group bacterium]|nr:NADPH-dependent FMN reductase [Patescibacteria group bacterium]